MCYLQSSGRWSRVSLIWAEAGDALWAWELPGRAVKAERLSDHCYFFTGRYSTTDRSGCNDLKKENGFKSLLRSDSLDPSALFPGDLEGKVKWLDNYQKVKQLRDALVWLPVWERDKRAFVPEVRLFGMMCADVRSSHPTVRLCRLMSKEQTGFLPSRV